MTTHHFGQLKGRMVMINFKRKSIMLVLTLSLMAGVIVPVETLAETSKVNQNESYTYEASEYLDYKSKIKDIYKTLDKNQTVIRKHTMRSLRCPKRKSKKY